MSTHKVITEAPGSGVHWPLNPRGDIAPFVLPMKDGVGGTTWATFGAFGVELPEISDPSAPTSNNGRLYVRDNGSGKTQLFVRFPTGAVQVIATEP